MTLCPHTFDDPHNLESLSANECAQCKGLIRLCPDCNAANRNVAIYCTTCGIKLPIEAKNIDRSNLAPAIKQRVKLAPNYSLSFSLGSESSDTPILWIAGDDGVFVFTNNRNIQAKETKLFYLPSYKFDLNQHGWNLSSVKPLPIFTDWVCKPLLSNQGVFVFYSTDMHYFPSHGGKRKYTHKVLKVDDGELILSAVISTNGYPTLLIKDIDSNLVLVKGNTQSGKWGEGSNRYKLNYKTENDAAYIFCSTYTVNDYWIYDGTNLIRFSTCTNSIELSSEIENGVQIPDTFEHKLDHNYFDPFIFKNNDRLSCVLPVKNNNEKTARVGLLIDVKNKKPIIIDSEHKHHWIIPSILEDGFLIATNGELKKTKHTVITGYVGKQPMWTVPMKESKVLPPIISQKWFSLQFLNTRTSFGQDPEESESITFMPSTLEHGRYEPLEADRKTARIGSKGFGTSALPPLYRDGNLYVALSDEGNAVTVYHVQVSTG